MSNRIYPNPLPLKCLSECAQTDGGTCKEMRFDGTDLVLEYIPTNEEWDEGWLSQDVTFTLTNDQKLELGIAILASITHE